KLREKVRNRTGYSRGSEETTNPLHERVCEALSVAEGVGFEPTVGFNTYSGLANRRTRPAMRPFRMKTQRLICGAKGGTRTPTPLRAHRPERCVSTNSTTLAWPPPQAAKRQQPFYSAGA